MFNGDARQSAARKSPDPSNKPWPGSIGGSFTASGVEATFTPDVRCNYRGNPHAIARNAAGEAIAESYDGSSDGTTILLAFDNDIAAAVLIDFGQKNPMVRGMQGQYVTPAGIPLEIPPAPFVVAMLADATEGGAWQIQWSEAMNQDGAAFTLRNNAGTDFTWDGAVQTGDGTATWGGTLTEGSGPLTPTANHRVSFPAYIGVSVDTAIPANEQDDFNYTEA
jgi:hypothetical protein